MKLGFESKVKGAGKFDRIAVCYGMLARSPDLGPVQLGAVSAVDVLYLILAIFVGHRDMLSGDQFCFIR